MQGTFWEFHNQMDLNLKKTGSILTKSEAQERKIKRNIFIVGFQSCRGGMTIIEAKKWFDKTYPVKTK